MFSGHISLFFPELFRNIPKESYPVLLAWDGSGHYAPTKILSVDKFHQWKIKCQVPRYLLGASMILKEINHQYLTLEQAQAANKVEKVIMESVQVLEPSLVAELARQNPPSTGLGASQDPGLSVPSPFSAFFFCATPSPPCKRKQTTISSCRECRPTSWPS